MKTQAMTPFRFSRRLFDGAKSRINGDNRRIAPTRSRSALSARAVLYRFCLLAGIIVVSVLNSQAQCFLVWSPSHEYDSGLDPRVAFSGATVVEVHNGGNGLVPLWYRVGQFDWATTTVQWGNSAEYDAHGDNPSVALSGSTVVEVHNGAYGVGPLWYRVGQVNASSKTISWGKSFEYDSSGFNPTVALSGSTVIEVHNADAGLGPLWYRVGQVNTSRKTIRWGRSFEYDNGFNPTVAVDGSAIVEVHNGGNGGVVPLWYRLGQLNGSSVQWGNSVQYDNGFNPTVGYAAGNIVEVHNGGYGGIVPLWYRLGYFNGTGINWEDSGEYDSNGMNPSVAVQMGAVVEVHDGADGVGPLWYRAGDVECIH